MLGSPRKQHGGGGGGSHSASFLLGALLPTLLLFFLASDRVGERLTSISTYTLGNNNNGSSSAHREQMTHDANLTDTDTTEERVFPGLAELLPRVATDDGTVIITSVNEAWSRPGSLLDLFRAGFNNGEGIAHLLNHTLIVAVDPGALAHCEAVHPHCYLLEVTSANVSSANRFMTKSYFELVWAKLELQQRVLQLGYSYLFTDVDIMWLRNPFRYISLYADMAVSTDRFNGDAEALTNAPNTGFYYVKSTNRTVEMLRRWRAARSRFPPTHDQAVFDEIKGELAGGELHIRFVFLETALFDGFCQLHDEMDRVCTMHANCCIGLENKVHDLTNMAADWKNYTSLAPAERRGSGRRWTAPDQCEESMRQR
ncbi:uncharacterized protein At4g15970-like [Triticum dicoccoides]|uniref:Nucleotide-diphospho-sugar transferase domain-containing protein n=2 Tax=Triticum TaxID=4564 RepID=A0A077RY10_WHEAT|nr:uncharacterized protein At4g15970-like [Triticum dicoccoides]XP_044345275.1 uncharacterized protein At4g15970-like [Triticum aestivum]CDM85738.1 unnamed protein product [Triticum aestivum]VAH83721.1 unnamed protein product [Triticum turgidum subsp. durum]